MMDILLIVITYGEFAFVNFNISLRRNRFLQGEEEKNNVSEKSLVTEHVFLVMKNRMERVFSITLISSKFFVIDNNVKGSQ